MHALVKSLVVASLFAAGFVAHGWIHPQDAKKQDGGMPPGPEATAEHKWLADGAGTWKATGKMFSPAGEMPLNGVQTNTMQKGGLWQMIEFKETNGGFQGNGISGYDTDKKKFVSVWVDSMGTSLGLGEGTLSADKKTLTMMVDMKGEDGKMMKVTETMTRKDDKTCVFEMSMPGPDGKPMKMLEINYTKN